MLRFQGGQRIPGVVDHRGGHTGQPGHGNAVAFAGGAGLDVVQKHDLVARLDRADMHVGRAVVLGRELGQLKIMGGKQRESLGFVVQVRGNATGQGQPVEGRGAAANLVHQHQ